LANIKSAKKRILVSAKKAARNKSTKSSVKTQIKKLEAAITNGDKEQALKELSALKSVMGKATAKGIYKKNTNGRKISRMENKVNKIGAAE